MKVIYEYSHLEGAEILHVRYPRYEREIRGHCRNCCPTVQDQSGENEGGTRSRELRFHGLWND